jgi:hypothetical protein
VVTSLEHAALPLLQLALSLAAPPIAYTFYQTLSLDAEQRFLDGMCQTLLKAAYTLPTDALFRRIPTFSQC